MCGDQFAPRYKDICDKVRTSLTGFHHPSRYGDAILKPVRKIRENEIMLWMLSYSQRAHFVRLLRGIGTELEHDGPLLSVHAREQRTKHAAGNSTAFPDISFTCSTTSTPFVAAERPEGGTGRKLSTSCAGPCPSQLRQLRFKTEYEQDLWSECSRLIANCIIFYNASILSRLLDHQERSGDTQGAEATKRAPPSPGSTSICSGGDEFQETARPAEVWLG